jgi:nuclear migration protein JNM1
LKKKSQANIQSSSPLITTLNKHDHLLSLLTQPRHLDAISRRVKLLLVDLDRAAAAARRNPSGSNSQPSSDKTVTLSAADYTALQGLFALLPRLDPLLPIVPPLLDRLRSLSGLHAAASEVADGLVRLRESEKKGGEEVKELTDIVEGVQKGLDEAGKTILTNWEGLERRLKELEQRVETLN